MIDGCSGPRAYAKEVCHGPDACGSATALKHDVSLRRMEQEGIP